MLGMLVRQSTFSVTVRIKSCTFQSLIPAMRSLASNLGNKPESSLASAHQSNPVQLTNPQTFIQKLVSKTHPDFQPYLKLMRLDRPVGSWLLFWPCGWSIALASPAGCLPDLSLLSLFAVGALIMRGAGCTINDMTDKDIDRKVARTKERPLASNQISSFNSVVFLACQLSLGLAILLQLNWPSILLGASSLALVVTYPWMKRITYWPQTFLGLTFNWGALLGWVAMTNSLGWPAVALYTGGVAWTLFYDTIYAHQDKYDDVMVGVKSTALRLGDQTPQWSMGFGAVMLTSLATAGVLVDQTWPFYAALALTGGQLAYQVATMKLNDPEDCARKFGAHKWIGLVIFLGIVGGKYLQSPSSIN